MKYFQKIRATVLSTELPLWKYCLLTYSIFFCTMVIVNVFINASAYLIQIHEKPETPKFGNALSDLVLISVIIPFTETIIISILLILCKKIFQNNNLASAIVAIMIGFTHSKPFFPYFIIFTVMFYFYSIFYLTRLKISYTNGFIAAFIPHALNNSIIGITSYFSI